MPAENQEDHSKPHAVSRKLLNLARPYWPHVAGIFVLSLISAPLGLLLAFPLKIAVDNVIGASLCRRPLLSLSPRLFKDPDRRT